uniref:Uncharacterized protein n=1 Tax=Romanomermis culicivorax TaxID=13658 RepID=A0A915JXK3_ROMCU
MRIFIKYKNKISKITGQSITYYAQLLSVIDMSDDQINKSDGKSLMNINRLSYSSFKDVADVLEERNDWRKLIEFTPCSSPETCSKYPSTSSAEHVLYELGDQGKTVSDLLLLLDKMRIEKAQLVLRRKYVPVKIVKQSAETIKR